MGRGGGRKEGGPPRTGVAAFRSGRRLGRKKPLGDTKSATQRAAPARCDVGSLTESAPLKRVPDTMDPGVLRIPEKKCQMVPPTAPMANALPASSKILSGHGSLLWSSSSEPLELKSGIPNTPPSRRRWSLSRPHSTRAVSRAPNGPRQESRARPDWHARRRRSDGRNATGRNPASRIRPPSARASSCCVCPPARLRCLCGRGG